MPWLGHVPVLDISYREEKGGVGTISFRLLGKDLASAEWLISQRIEGEKVADQTGRRKLPEAWWGDRNWKTIRNQASWPAPRTEETVGEAGTVSTQVTVGVTRSSRVLACEQRN